MTTVTAVVVVVAAPLGLLVLLFVGVLIVQPPIVSEADRADALAWVLVEEGPPIGGSFDLKEKSISLVLRGDLHHPWWFLHGMGKAACDDAGLLPWPYALPGWTTSFRYAGESEPVYTCQITSEVQSLLGVTRRVQQGKDKTVAPR